MAEYIEKAELIKKLCFETAEWYYSPTIKTIKEFPAADVQPVKHGKDVMKVLQQVSDTCERTRMCMECEFYSKNSGMCVFADMPIFWKHDEIEKALRDGDAE